MVRGCLAQAGRASSSLVFRASACAAAAFAALPWLLADEPVFPPPVPAAGPPVVAPPPIFVDLPPAEAGVPTAADPGPAIVFPPGLVPDGFPAEFPPVL